MEIAGINIVVRDYLKKNKIKFGEVAEALGMSQSNFSERLRSTRSLSLDEFMVLYKMCGSSFAGEMMAYYKMPLMFQNELKEITEILMWLKPVYKQVLEKNNRVFEIIEQISNTMGKLEN